MRIWAFALNTFKETIRNRILINILLFAIGLILLSLIVGDWSLNEQVKIIKDFLPSPEELIFKDKTVKVTIALSKTSVDYFKQVAKSYNTQYQKMIRRLLDEYVSKQKITS